MHAQLMNAGWSVTYTGQVSYMKLVSMTSTLTFWVLWRIALPVEENAWLGSSSKRRATSMFRNLSPRLDPSAMAARWDEESSFIPRS